MLQLLFERLVNIHQMRLFIRYELNQNFYRAYSHYLGFCILYQRIQLIIMRSRDFKMGQGQNTARKKSGSPKQTKELASKDSIKVRRTPGQNAISSGSNKNSPPDGQRKPSSQLNKPSLRRPSIQRQQHVEPGKRLLSKKNSGLEADSEKEEGGLGSRKNSKPSFHEQSPKSPKPQPKSTNQSKTGNLNTQRNNLSQQSSRPHSTSFNFNQESQPATSNIPQKVHVLIQGPKPSPPSFLNKGASVLRSPLPRVNPIKALNKYSKNYNPLSQFDILNFFYQMRQNPQEVQQNLILNLSKHLKALFKNAESSDRSYTIDKINFTELTGLQEPNLSNIKKFWLALIVQFIKNHHPYCSFEGIITLIQFHIKQNHDFYYPNGKLNMQIYEQNKVLEGVINKNSQLFTTVLSSLQRMVSVYVNQMCSIVAAIPQNVADKLLAKQQIIMNVWNVFKLMYNNDYQVKEDSSIRLKIASDLISMVYIIHNKNPACFTKPVVAEFINYFDSHVQYISRGLDIRVPASQDKSSSGVLGRKCIRLINKMLFQFPYQIQKWDEPIRKCIKQTKSECLIPFKWIIHHKKPEISMLNSLSNRSNYTDEDQYKNYYFPIVGSEWILLLHNLIQYQNTQGANQHFSEIIFFLVCSVIEENPIGFWTDVEEYEEIHNYISELFANFYSNQHNNNYHVELGRLCRIMLCACGKLNLQQNAESCEQTIQKIKHESVMLKVMSSQSREQQHRLSNLVFNHFASNIIGIKNVDRRVLFGEVLMGYLITRDQQYPIYNFDDPILVKYHYQFPNLLIHDLIIRILIDDPQTITQLNQLWERELKKYTQTDDQPNIPLTYRLTNFLQRFTINYNTNIQESFYLKAQQYQYEYGPLENLQVFPHIMELFNKMLLNESTRNIVFQLLQKNDVPSITEINVLLDKCLIYEVNVNALCRHVEVLYELGLNQIRWVTHLCTPIIEKLLGQWEESVARHYANITRIAVHRQCLSDYRNASLKQVNLLAIDPRTELLRSDVKNYESHTLKIPQLTKYSDYVLEFIKWALRVEEDILRQEYFYNALFSNRRYQSLQAGLNLLQTLMIVYMKFHDRVYFTEKLKRFLAICNTSRKLGTSLNNTALSIAPQIALSNKKLATLPAALTYLVCEPHLNRGRRLGDSQTIKAKQIRSKALNILNLIILNNNTSVPYLYSVQENTQILQDSLSTIDFNIYEQFFINDSQKIYCSSQKILLDYIKSQVSNRTISAQLTPQLWFQSSYNYGQCIDIAAQTNKLFRLPEIHEAIEERIQTEYENGDRLRISMKEAMSRFYLQNNFGSKVIAGAKSVLHPILANYICDREVAAFSRYLLHFAIVHKQENTYQEQFFLKLLTVVLNKLLYVIVETPECKQKNKIIEPITTNIWKVIRILQTKKKLHFYIKTIITSMPFILSTYFLNIDKEDFANEYLITLRLILACREYLNPTQYGQVLAISGLKQMLIILMRENAEQPKFYTNLFYCLNFYSNLVDNQKSSREQFKSQILSIYNSVNETINPALVSVLRGMKTTNKKQAYELCNDVSVVQLIMFFKLHIPEEISFGSQSLYNLLVISSADRPSTFNYQSLLLNMESRPNTQSIEAALKIANGSRHYLEYISACNHIYRALGNLDRPKDNQQIDHAQNLMGQKILAFIERGLDMHPVNDTFRSGENWKNIVFMKSWACNLLYVLMGYCSRALLIKICNMLMNKSNLISLLGELLSVYGSIQLRWQYTGSKNLQMPMLGLLEKQLLLSILKVYTVMIAKSDDWIKKSGELGRNNVYYSLCKSFVSASKVLTKNLSRSSASGHNRDSRYSNLNPLPGSVARNEYEQSLEKLSREYLYKNYLLNLETRQQQKNTMKSTEHNNKIESSKLQLLHPDCNNSLDVVHSHLNLLITQQYLMILLGCYSNEHLTLETYQYHEILSIFESTTKRLIDIYEYRQIFQHAMTTLDIKIWNCYRMDTNLYYLNTVQESPRETLNLLDSVAEICFNCIVNLKGIMEMHKDYRDFIARTDKLLKQASKSDKVFSFGLKDQMEKHGFDKKSQYGTSFMMSPSARLSR